MSILCAALRLADDSDTLFLAGCGRFFEGTPEEMHTALTHLGKLPDDTVVYNGHEYTKGSAKFGLSIEPDNEALKGCVYPIALSKLSMSCLGADMQAV